MQEDAVRVAAPLILAVLDGDTEAARVLLAHTSREVLGQAAVLLAQWIAGCISDPAAFRAEFAAALSGS